MLFQVLLERLALMLLYMIPGYVLYKKKLLTDNGVKDLGRLLLYVLLPASVINSYNIDFTTERVIGLGISFGLAVAVVLVAVLLSKSASGKSPSSISVQPSPTPALWESRWSKPPLVNTRRTMPPPLWPSSS